MRDYSKVSPTFWTGDTGKALRRRGIEAVVVGVYLMTAPNSNMLGLYYQPLLYAAHETGLGVEGVSKGLRACIDVGFCQYDPATEMVWIVEMAAYQIAEELKGTDLRCKGIQRDYDSLPNCPFLGSWFDRYQAAFHLTRRRSVDEEKPEFSEGATKPLRSQEQEQEQEKEISASPPSSASPKAGLSKFPPGFEEFWNAYPRKVGKDAAIKAYAKRRFTEEQRRHVLAAIAEQRTWEQWTRDGGQYVPHPATWLNEGRWQDEAAAGERTADRFAGSTI